MTAAHSRRALACVAASFATLLVVIAVNTSGWVGRTFPGFFVMANGVVASIALPEWRQDDPMLPFQLEVTAVDGAPVRGGPAVYEVVARTPPGTRHTYLVQDARGVTRTVAVPSRQFSRTDYLLIFGVYLLTSVAFLSLGLLVPYLKPRDPTAVGFAIPCLLTGLFILTACDLYGPSWFFRLHVAAEALLAPAFVHLSLVFPRDRLRHRRMQRLAIVYAPFVVLAVLYERVLYDPAAYTSVHLLATATHGLAAAVIIGVGAFDLLTSRSPLVRRRIGIVTLGILGGFALPGILMVWSAATGGAVAINAGAFTAFVFPLCLAYAVVKQNLFDLDVVLRRAVTYAIVVVLVCLAYMGTFWLLQRTILASLWGSPLPIAALNVVLLLVLAPVQARVQAAVDRLFFRGSYDPESELSDLSHRLSAAQTEAQVRAALGVVLGRALAPRFLRLARYGDGRLVETDGRSLALPSKMATALRTRGIVTPYDVDQWADASSRTVWEQLDAELLLAVASDQDLLGAVFVGARESGRPYRVLDMVFLRAAAGQVALGVRNAEAFGRLEELNASLEAQVSQRTADLERANGEVQRSLAELQLAYAQLERSQQSLVRIDRLATLGRVAAGVAHEVNTPLAAVMNELALLQRLAREYQDSIGDPVVTAEDHHAIAAELERGVAAATAWAKKAAAYIRRMKLHSREPGTPTTTPFAVRAVVEDVRGLLEHRLRALDCRIELHESAPGTTLRGDATRLGQVLVNLVANALDAYEDSGRPATPIVIRARADASGTVLEVEDGAGGMAPDVAARVFDELYTTKEPGRGTGLGLWISRSLVEEAFGGTLVLETEEGAGSRFVITVPAGSEERARPRHVA